MMPAPLPWSKPFVHPKSTPEGWGTLQSRRSYKYLELFVPNRAAEQVRDSDKDTTLATNSHNNAKDIEESPEEAECSEWGQFAPIEEEETEEEDKEQP
eukprot:Sro33_g021300.2  (98) ;mRNA; f:44645-44938